MSDSALTPKQARFVEEFLIDLNATQAAIRAGYSKHTASEQGSRLLSYAKVADAVGRGSANKSKRAKKSADWVIRRLEAEAKSKDNTGAERISALDKLGRHHGIYEVDNDQLSTLAPVSVTIKSVSSSVDRD